MSLPKEVVNRVDKQIELGLTEINHFQGDLKTLTKEDFDKLRESIIKEGFIHSPHVWFDPGKKKWFLLDGHQRHHVLSALSEEGYHLPKIKCTAVIAPTFEKAKAYVLLMSSTYGKMSDESVSQYFIDSGLDFTELSKMLDLPGVDLDLEDFNVSGTEGLTDEDQIPDVVEPKAKRGDIYKLGNHRLMCGDSTSEDDVAKLMDGEKADMVFTDPPYGIGYEYANHDDSNPEENKKLVENVFRLHQCGKVWTPGLMNLGRDLERFGKTKVAVWYKKFAQAGNGIGGASTWEPVLIFNPTEKSLSNDVIVISTEREFVNGKNLRELHSCPKPVGLFEHLIKSLSKDSDVVFEPFCGSGTTLIACEKTGRSCRGMEMDPQYIDVIITRWEQFTGQTAELISQSEA